MRFSYRNYWGNLRQFQVPEAIIQNNKCILDGSALAILLVLLDTARSQQSFKEEDFVSVGLKHKTLMQRTGLSKNVITKATKELDRYQFIKRIPGRTRRGEFAINRYLICNPSNGEPLRPTGASLRPGEEPRKGRNLLYANGIRYLNVPTCIVREFDANWSLAHLSSSETRLYVSVIWHTNRSRSGQIALIERDLLHLTGLRPTTFGKAIDALGNRNLILVSRQAENDEKARLSITLNDPYTGEPLPEQNGRPEDDPARYFVEDAKRRSKRLNLNSLTPELRESVIRSCFPSDGNIQLQASGDLKVPCPFHEDQNPSCSVSTRKNCFYCFGCKQKGTLTDFVMSANKTDKAGAIRHIASRMSVQIAFHKPDKLAEARYCYFDKAGRLVKEVLRYDGKEFSQRRPGGGGTWVWNTNGVAPILYNRQRLEYANTVVICEGEKDCDTVTNLGLVDRGGCDIVATTSGGAHSWNDELADDLIGRRVVLMPDADSAGRECALEVEQSLRLRGITYRMVNFTDVKDVTEFLEGGHSVDELVELMGNDWIAAAVLPNCCASPVMDAVSL